MDSLTIAICTIAVLLGVVSLIVLVRQRDLGRRYRTVADIDTAVAKGRRELEQATAEREEVTRRYGAITDIDAAVTKARHELEQITAERDQVVAARTKQLETLDTEYREAKVTYDRLKHELGLLEENLEDISFGIYKPHYDYQTPDAYKAAMTT